MLPISRHQHQGRIPTGSISNVLFLVGPPNSGKSTQGQLLVNETRDAHLVSAGSWLRSLREQNTLLGSYVHNNWNHAGLEAIVVQYVSEEVERYARNGNKRLLVVDGFPRTLEEASALSKMCTGLAVVVVELVASEEQVKCRAESRARLDDDGKQALEIRIQSYSNKMVQIREFLTQAEVFYQVRACGTVEEVKEQIKNLVVWNSRKLGDCISACPSKQMTAALEKEGKGNSLRPQYQLVVLPGGKRQYKKCAVPRKRDDGNGEENINSETQVTALTHAIPRARPTTFIQQANPIETAEAIQATLLLSNSTRQFRSFCGTHPISLERSHLERLLLYPYLVSLKADGLRYLLLIRKGCFWFVDRKLSVWRSFVIEELFAFEDTLLDGEILLTHNGKLTTFLIIDCLCFQGSNKTHDYLQKRLSYCDPLLNSVAELGFMMSLIFTKQTYCPFKDLANLIYLRTGSSDSASLERLFLSHSAVSSPSPSSNPAVCSGPTWPIDGIVFTPRSLPYRLGIDFNMLKWKPPDNNTVDFVFREPDRLCARVMPPSSSQPFSALCSNTMHPRGRRNKKLSPSFLPLSPTTASLSPSSVSSPSSSSITSARGATKTPTEKQMGRLPPQNRPPWLRDGQVVECYVDRTLRASQVDGLGLGHTKPADTDSTNTDSMLLPYRVVRSRADKDGPNCDWVALNIIRSIEGNLTLEEILETSLQVANGVTATLTQ